MCVFLYAGLSLCVVGLHHYIRNSRTKAQSVKEYEKRTTFCQLC